MRPQDTIEAVVVAIRDADELPDQTKFFGYQPNIDTEAIKLPLVEARPISEARIDDHNTDNIGVIEDDNGNTVQQVYQVLYNMTIEVNVWTAQGSRYDPNDLGDTVYSILYQYDSSGPDNTLDDNIWRVRLGDGSPDQDFTTSPTLRQWSQELDLWVHDDYTTDTEYIVDVVTPADQDFGNSVAIGDIDNA